MEFVIFIWFLNYLPYKCLGALDLSNKIQYELDLEWIMLLLEKQLLEIDQHLNYPGCRKYLVLFALMSEELADILLLTCPSRADNP